MSGCKVTLSEKIFDEIALEGLEGITLSTLWLYLADTMKLSAGLPHTLKIEIWEFIKRNTSKLQFFELPTERPTFNLYKRFEKNDEDFGVPLAMDEYCQRPYKIVPIEKNGILGSCECYEERKEIDSDNIKDMSLNDVENYGGRFVIVASQDLRFNALFPPSVLIPRDIHIQPYCMLEAIGRSRFNGETTSGILSLQNYCKDSALVFYWKNKLSEMGVIATQNYNELRKGRISQTTLVTLPRFYVAYQNSMNFIIENAFHILQTKPDYSLPLFELRYMFPVVRKLKTFKRITDTHEFRRIFNVTTVQKPLKKERSNVTLEDDKYKNVVIVSLRDPNMSPMDLFVEKNSSNGLKETDEDENGIVNKLAYVDMLIKDQVYNAIFRHGIRGISQSEICCSLGLSNLTVRQLLKIFMEEKRISAYSRDAGRQRTHMYVASEFAANVSDYNASISKIESLKCNDNLIPPPQAQENIAEISEVTSTVEPFKYIVKMNRKLSSRQTARMGMVINKLNEKSLVHVNEVFNSLAAIERDQGCTDRACRKSLRRVLNNLCENSKINIYEVILKLKKGSNVRVHRFITHPKIHIDHEIIKNEILRLKNAFYLKVEEHRLHQESQRQAAISKLKKKKEHKHQISEEGTKCEQKREVFQKLPKFLVSRYVHEFLFYITLECDEHQTPQEITEDVIQEWKKTDPSFSIKEYMDLIANEDKDIRYYTKDLSWRTFIPPLEKYPDKPTGWVYLLDAIDRMPLSIFMKIFSLENNIGKNLESYITHPIRQHYLVKQLPVELSTLINRVYMQKVFLIALKLMNHMGLIQVSNFVNPKDKLLIWVYLNRNATIVDTTPTEASYSKINPTRIYESIGYTFNTYDDLYSYWMNLQRICIYTKLGFRKNKEKSKQKVPELRFIGYVGFEEAPINDSGRLPGDGLGAGGLSSDLFAHIFRFWTWVIPSSAKLKAGYPHNNRRMPMTLETKNKLLRKKRAGLKKQNFPVTLVKRLIPSSSSACRNFSKNVSTCTKSRNRVYFRDDIDREALKNMRTLRVNWSAEEDKIIKIARAVYVFLSPPVISLPLVSVAEVCRDIIGHTIGIRNKTIQSCLRRFNFLIKNNRHLPETPLWINMLETNENLTEKYNEDFISNLRNIYPERSKFCNALVVHFTELMCFVFKYINDILDAPGPSFCIPNDINEFESMYQIRSYTKNDETPLVYENPRTDNDLKVSVVYAILHASMCCVRDKTLFTLQAFEIFKHYSEDVLKTAYAKARNDGLAVVLKRKYMTSQLTSSQIAGPSYLLSSKYRFKLTSLKITYQIFEAVFNTFQNIFEAVYGDCEPIANAQSSNQYYEFKSPHIGQLLAMSEGLTQNYWKLIVHFPVNGMLTVDSEQPISTADRIIDHYHGILENAPKIDYIKNISNENIDKQIRIKFHSANLSYKIYYTPYDFISKLPERYLHFFCALDHLQQSVDINFIKLQRVDYDSILECPFNCIMKNNYIDAIDRIVREKKDVLADLQETSTQKLLNQIANGNSSIKIQTSNLLAIVRKLEMAWRNKEEAADRKDLGGKKMMEIKSKNPIDWIQICREILDFDAHNEDHIYKTDEYEPMLTKDDRMRDAFLLNLPTIQLMPSDKLKSDTYIRYNFCHIPQLLAPVEYSRQDILGKVERDSLWVYTENNLISLKAELNAMFDEIEQRHIEAMHNAIAAKKFGISFKELLREFPYKCFLHRALKFLMDNYLVKRVGVSEHVYVHKSNLREWVVHTFHMTRINQENLKAKKRMLEQDDPSTSSSKRLKRDFDRQEEALAENSKKDIVAEIAKDSAEKLKDREIVVLRPRPWIRLNGSINRRVLDRWLGSILNECLARNGCCVTDLCAHFQNIFPADIYFLLEILSDMKCLSLTESEIEEIDIFSECKEFQEVPIKEINDPACTYVIVLPDASSRMTNFIGNKKYNVEFI